MAIHIRRREFIGTLGSAVAWPLAAHAQQHAMPVIGWLGMTSPGYLHDMLAAFHRGLKEASYVEGQNVSIEYRWAEGQYDRLPALAAELVQRQVTVIVTTGGPASALAAKAATTTIPVVFSSGGDPIQTGLVASLSRPGGNVTGATFFTTVLEAKRLELLHEVVPNVGLIAVLVNPTNGIAERQLRDTREAAARLGIRLVVLNASNEAEIETSFATLVQGGGQGASRCFRSVFLRST
jgi:putative ABC transport system substrate-binding protein